MTAQSGGTVSGYPGVASDGADGLLLTGSIQAGPSDPYSKPTNGTPYAMFTGTCVVADDPGNNTGHLHVVDIVQSQTLEANSTSRALYVERTADVNGHDYTAPVVSVVDACDSTANLIEGYAHGDVQLRVNKWGGVGQYGVVPPVTQPLPTIVTSTITDAVAKAAISALILLINNSGMALVTES